MSFSRPLVLLIVVAAGFWQHGDSCVRQKYAKVKTDKHYEKLLDIDTGYPHKQLKKRYDKLKSSPTWRVEVEIEDVYRKLYCSYVFNCSHYMNLIKPLLTAEGEDALKKLILAGETDAMFSFIDNVVDMLNVLYNFGTIGTVDQLWLVYMYSVSLNALDKNDILNESTRIRLLYQHETFSSRLAQFTQLHCNIKDNNNDYNDQYVDSIYSSYLNEIYAKPKISHEVIKILMNTLKAITKLRIDKITETMNIDNCKSYFEMNHLLLRPAIDDWNILHQILEDFAAISEVSQRRDTFFLVDEDCYEKNLNVKSFETLTNGVAKCHEIFTNIIKYIMIYNSWKHVFIIAVYLPFYNRDLPPAFKVKERKQWATWDSAISWIQTYNSFMYKCLNKIVSFLHLKEDKELKFITELFRSPFTAYDLADVKINNEVENDILNILKSVNYIKFNLNKNGYDKKYFKERFKMLWRKCKIRDFVSIDFLKSYFMLESVLSTFLFNEEVRKSFSGIDFEVIGSFNHFLENKACFN